MADEQATPQSEEGTTGAQPLAVSGVVLSKAQLWDALRNVLLSLRVNHIPQSYGR
ncbi:MAG TPA: hypothetical protein VJM51_08755 [Dehalococcoidia bacterium]|nr:hypothetical protein [Dehalococcoidia bacterium]